jgi:hypothetical protein
MERSTRKAIERGFSHRLGCLGLFVDVKPYSDCTPQRARHYARTARYGSLVLIAEARLMLQCSCTEPVIDGLPSCCLHG